VGISSVCRCSSVDSINVGTLIWQNRDQEQGLFILTGGNMPPGQQIHGPQFLKKT
jgi:hypothetical protein